MSGDELLHETIPNRAKLRKSLAQIDSFFKKAYKIGSIQPKSQRNELGLHNLSQTQFIFLNGPINRLGSAQKPKQRAQA